MIFCKFLRFCLIRRKASPIHPPQLGEHAGLAHWWEILGSGKGWSARTTHRNLRTRRQLWSNPKTVQSSRSRARLQTLSSSLRCCVQHRVGNAGKRKAKHWASHRSGTSPERARPHDCERPALTNKASGERDSGRTASRVLFLARRDLQHCAPHCLTLLHSISHSLYAVR